MHWQQQLVDRLAAYGAWSYRAGHPSASEPTALAALALTAHHRFEPANRAVDWLADVQSRDGSVGIAAGEPNPRWPTALAILAWSAWQQATASRAYAARVERGVAWALQAHGATAPRRAIIGHDPTLVGWPWVLGTHSWLEPTAMFVLALRATQHAEHPRTRQAVRLLVDRLLPQGGCNYGNTVVLGQTLLAHVQPTGLVMLALAGEPTKDPRIERSLLFLEEKAQQQTGTASLCWATMALAAHGHATEKAHSWLGEAYHRSCVSEPNPYHDALLALAILGVKAPLVRDNTRSETHYKRFQNPPGESEAPAEPGALGDSRSARTSPSQF
jgi:hypothetical protein